MAKNLLAYSLSAPTAVEHENAIMKVVFRASRLPRRNRS
jgi:hypothetical protein